MCFRLPALGPVRLGAGDLDRAEDGAGLVDGLVPLVARLRVDDGAAAGLHVETAILDHDGANVDRRVEAPVPEEVADRAAVATALDRLELVDDLHRADLGRAGEGPGGEA